MVGQALLMKMLITLEPCGIFGTNFVYTCIVTSSSRWYAKRSISLAGGALLVKRLITLEPHGVFFIKFYLLIQFYIVWTMVYKTKTMLHRASWLVKICI